jgi:hypothetical protein
MAHESRIPHTGLPGTCSERPTVSILVMAVLGAFLVCDDCSMHRNRFKAIFFHFYCLEIAVTSWLQKIVKRPAFSEREIKLEVWSTVIISSALRNKNIKLVNTGIQYAWKWKFPYVLVTIVHHVHTAGSALRVLVVSRSALRFLVGSRPG